MVVLRLTPKGKKRQKTYRVVADSKSSKLDGKPIEDLGWLNRHTDEYDLKRERVEYWLSVGAQPSNSVHNLLVTAGIIDAKKKPAHSTRKRKKGDSEESTEETKKETKDQKEEGSDSEEKPEESSEENDKESEEKKTEEEKEEENKEEGDEEDKKNKDNEEDNEEDNEDEEKEE